MMILAGGYITALLIGGLIFRILLARSPRINPLCQTFLAFALGVGVCVHMTGYLFVAVGEYNRTLLWLAHGGALSIAAARWYCTRQTALRRPSLPVNSVPRAVLQLIVLLLIGLLVYKIAAVRPWGEWDGWAVWNQKFRFLILGGRDWTNLFTVHPTARPDYPLFLPLWNAWAWPGTDTTIDTAPLLSGVIFTCATMGLLGSGLSIWVRPAAAGLAFILLAFFFPFLAMGTSQYADIVVSFYLLAALLCLLLSVREQDAGYARLAGILLGFLLFVKNEGPVLAGLLMLCAGVYQFGRTGRGSPNRFSLPACWLAGIAVTLPLTIIYKCVLAPPAPDVLRGVLSQPLPYADVPGLNLVIGHMISVMSQPPFIYLWGLLALMFILAPYRYIYRETKMLTLFFFLYIIVLTGVYMTTIDYDLDWRLSRTFSRILTYLTPAILFWNFYAWFGGSTDESANLKGPSGKS